MATQTTDAIDRARSRQPRLALLLFFCVVVLVFRTASWQNPSRFIVIPEGWGLPLAALGTLFLACGVWVWATGPSHLAGVFLAYGVGGAIHWGGTIASANPQLEIAFVVLYMAATAMGDAAFLHLALRYPRQQAPWGRRVRLLYLLAILTLLAVPVAPFLPTGVVESGLGFIIGAAFLMSISGGIVFLVKWIRATPAERRESFLTLIVIALVGASVVDLLADGGVLPGQPEAWTLVYGVEPLILAWAVTRLRDSSPRNLEG